MGFAPASPLILDGMSKFFSLVYHRFINAAVFAFTELGIADLLNEGAPDLGLTVKEMVIKNRSEWNSDLLYRLLRSCADVGLVNRINNIDNDVHDHDLIRMTLGPALDGAYGQLSQLVRNSNVDMTRATGGLDFFSFISQPDQREFLASYQGAMTAYSVYNSDKLIAAIDFSQFLRIVDIGGGNGAFLAEILHRYPRINHGIVFDLASVVTLANNAEEFLSRGIVKDKITFIAGDMFDSSTIPQGDAYILKHISHAFGDEQVVSILTSIRKANEGCTISPTLFIIEHIILDDGAISNWFTHAMDLGVRCCTPNSRERSLNEFRKLLEQAGFEIKQFYPVQVPHSIIEAIIYK